MVSDEAGGKTCYARRREVAEKGVEEAGGALALESDSDRKEEKEDG